MISRPALTSPNPAFPPQAIPLGRRGWTGGRAGIGGADQGIARRFATSVPWLCIGVTVIGLGGRLITNSTETAALALATHGHREGMSSAGGMHPPPAIDLAIALGGALDDIVALFGSFHLFGLAVTGIAAGAQSVHCFVIVLLLITLVAVSLPGLPAGRDRDRHRSLVWPSSPASHFA